MFHKVTGNLGINFEHVEDNYLDINRQKLIPYQISDRGPALAFGDLNGDGKKICSLEVPNTFRPEYFYKGILPIWKSE